MRGTARRRVARLEPHVRVKVCVALALIVKVEVACEHLEVRAQPQLPTQVNEWLE